MAFATAPSGTLLRRPHATGQPRSRASTFFTSARPLRTARATKPSRRTGISASTASSAAAPPEPAPEPSLTGRSRLLVGFYFGLWYFFNTIFNIVNKNTLNRWPYPWTMSLVQLGVGSLYCTVLWFLRLRTRPNVSWGLLRAMVLPVIGHTLGHVLSCVSFSHVAISFTHVVKSAEPAFGALGAALALGEVYPWGVYATLVPVIVGVAMSAVSELTFTMWGFTTAMMSNVAFAARNIFTKITMKDYKNDETLTPQNMYGLISIMSFLFELPMALIADRGIPSLMSPLPGVSKMEVFKFLAGSSLLYHLYNETSYLALARVSPITFSVANTLKRVIIIITAVIVFKTKVLPMNAIGMAIAILGTFLYSLSKEKLKQTQQDAQPKAA